MEKRYSAGSGGEVKIRLTNGSGLIKEADWGFSWKTFFFGMFVPLVRGDVAWFFIGLCLVVFTAGIGLLIFPFVYNKIYVKKQLEKGFYPLDELSRMTLVNANLILDKGPLSQGTQQVPTSTPAAAQVSPKETAVVEVPRPVLPTSTPSPQAAEAPPPSPTGWACVSCRAENAPENRFCFACGREREKPKPVCPQCGKENQPGMRFCPSCGAALPDQGGFHGSVEMSAERQGYPETGVGQPINSAALLSNMAKGMICLGLAAVVIISPIIFTQLRGREKEAEIARDYAVAEVDGKKIMRSEIEAGMARMAEKSQVTEINSEDLPLLRESVLDSIVVESALKKEAAEKNIKVSDEEVQKVVTQIESQFPTKEAFMQYMEQTGVNEKKLKEDISGRLAQQKVLENLAGSVFVSDDEVRKFYDSTKGRFFRRPTGYKVNFASFATREQAQKARGQIVADGDWDKVLEAMSGDVRNSTPYAKPTFIAEKELKGEMKILPQLPVGKVSPPVSVTSEDIVLVLKREKSPERVLSLAEVKGEIQKMLASQKEREIQQKFLQELKAKTSLNILDPIFFEVP